MAKCDLLYKTFPVVEGAKVEAEYAIGAQLTQGNGGQAIFNRIVDGVTDSNGEVTLELDQGGSLLQIAGARPLYRITCLPTKLDVTVDIPDAANADLADLVTVS